MRVRLEIIAAAFLAVACGGGPNGPVGDCYTTSSQCAASRDSGLRFYAAKSGRMMGTALDVTFGTSVAYDSVVAREFSFITAGNAQKWQNIHPARATYNFTRGDQMLAFAQSKGAKMRGHTLAWYNQNPSWLTNGVFSADTLTQILVDHINTVLTHYKGTIYAWDVVNEAWNDNATLRANVWSNTLGKSYIETAFRTARAADPAALLFYNDYNLEYTGAKQDSAFFMLQDFKTRGVPVDGIGFQGHFQINSDGSGMPTRASMIATFQRFAALNLKVHITELDVRIRVPGATSVEVAAQAQAYTDVVAACMAVAACEVITVWGVTDTESWIPSTFPGYGSALLFDGNLAKKSTWSAVKTALGG